jgi:predicted RNA polymerase sigma factor
MTQPWDASSESLLRELAPQVLGALTRRYRDFASAEDAVQEAMLAAFTQWPQQGVPENPRGWLIQVASRRMTDQARSEIARRQRETEVARDAETMAVTGDIEADMDSRHSDFAVHVLPPGAHLVLSNSPDAARRRWLNHSGNCPGIPGSRSNHGATHQPRQAKYSSFPRALPSAASAPAL